MSGAQEEAQGHAARIAAAAQERGFTVAVAESLTSGAIASRLGEAEEASVWFRGAVVAYASEVKFDVLGVTPGPVVTAETAEQMATGVRGLLGADWAVAVTGAGGPGPQEGKPAGTVYFAVAGPDHTSVHHRELQGDPAEVVAETVAVTLGALWEAIADWA